MLNALIKPDCVANIENIKPRLIKRAGIVNSVRQFFNKNDFCEIETPVAIKSPAPEEFIESQSAGELFLRPSPELQMKIMLAAGFEKIYQIGSCFRSDEFGRKHRPEFTMLEWYQTHADYRDIMNFTTEMLREIASTIIPSRVITYNNNKINFNLPPEIITVNDAFIKYAGINSEEAIINDKFDELMVTVIEPKLGDGRITFIKDYPASRAALAKINNSNPPYAERWELYLAGMEIANAYTELTDVLEQQKRFDLSNQYRNEHGLTKYPTQYEFIEAMHYGMPSSAGCALGIDRLVMIFTDADDISQVKIPLS